MLNETLHYKATHAQGPLQKPRVDHVKSHLMYFSGVWGRGFCLIETQNTSLAGEYVNVQPCS